MSGRLFIIAAPSGTGKTSLVKALTEAMDNVLVSVSHTTRPKRPAEKDGENYFFIEQDQFDKMVAEQAFLEYARVFGHSYGTSKAWILKQLQQGNDIILEIDWQGAAQVRALYPEAVSIFIMPPSLSVLRERLETRGQDAPEVIEGRLAKAEEEMSHRDTFDYSVVNDDFEQALQALKAIVNKNKK